MQRRKKEKLVAVQLQHWLRAVTEGKKPTIIDPITKQVITKNLPLAVSDGECLTFTLSESGKASWILRYRFGGRARELTLGNFPDISLGDARKIAREERAKIDRGGDPAADKRKAKGDALDDWTVRILIDDYQQKILFEKSLSTQRSYSRNLRRIEQRLGSVAVTAVDSKEIVGLIKGAKTPRVEAQMLMCTLKAVFKHAEGLQLISSNPCVGITLTSILGARPEIRKRLMLSESELALLLNANMRRENILAIKLLLATAVRSDELVSSKWEQFDLENGVWCIPKTKTGPGMDVPLTQAAVTWLRELKGLSQDSKFVLPARKERGKIRLGGDASISKDTIREAIDYWLAEYKPKCRRFTPHDLRSTAKSQMRSLGISNETSEMCLNHKLSGVTGIYDVHTYFDERKQALIQLSNFLVRVENDLALRS